MNDEIFMHRCLELARNAQGRTYPNPFVGSVIVYNGKIIGEGFHKRAGEPHAEVMAINSVKDKSLLPKSTLYVNLEPCSHYGRTPPCADLIVKWKIPRVVVGTIDTSAKVSGKGIARMRSAGIDVKVGVLEKESRWLNRRFFTYNEKKRPYIILKWAESNDGFIDPVRNSNERKSIPISSELAHILVHKWRSQEQAIMVGTNTVIKDNPQLTTRLWYGPNPMRICIDVNGRIPQDSKIFDSSAQTICLKSQNYKNIDSLLSLLYQNQIQSIIIEGGAKLISSFLDNNKWDEIRIFKSKSLYLHGLKAPNLKGKLVLKQDLEKETLFVTINSNETYISDIQLDSIHFL